MRNPRLPTPSSLEPPGGALGGAWATGETWESVSGRGSPLQLRGCHPACQGRGRGRSPPMSPSHAQGCARAAGALGGVRESCRELASAQGSPEESGGAWERLASARPHP